MLSRSFKKALRRGLALTLACWGSVVYAEGSLAQDPTGWSEGAPLPAEATRAVLDLVISSHPFQMGNYQLGLSDKGLGTKLRRLQEQFKDLSVEDDPMKLRIVFNSDVLFDFDSASIRPDAEASLRAVVGILKDFEGKTIRIVGHTDSKGSDSYNQTLSMKRAESVKAWLAVTSELKAYAFDATGRGEHEPRVSNTLADGSDDPAGRQKNRRVEIEISKEPR